MDITLKEKILTELIDELENDRLVLPSLPEVALKVRDTASNPNVTSKQLAEIIGNDAALTARLIQIANSPLLRGAQRIDSLNLAITRMGSGMVKNCVNSIIVKQIFHPKTTITEKRFKTFWEHSTEVAAISVALASVTRLKGDEAMLAGLVHDIGTLPIIKRAETIPELLADEQLFDEITAELHTRIGHQLLLRWEFPSAIAEAAGAHENLRRHETDSADITDIVIVANLQSYFGKTHPHADAPWETVPAFAKLGIATDFSFLEEGDTNESVGAIQKALMG